MEYSQSQKSTPKGSFKKNFPRILIIFLSVFFVFEAAWAALWMYLSYFISFTWEYKIENFLKYKADFESVKDECLNYISTHPQTGENPTFRYSGTESNQLFVSGDPVIENESARKHLKCAAQAFPAKNAYFSFIKAKDGLLFFGSEIDDYQMVYLPDTEPLTTLTNMKEYSVRKAANGWYHMAHTNQGIGGIPAPILVRMFVSQ